MISEVYAMAPRPGGQGSGGLGSFIVPLLFMFAIFYFFLIRPQKKRDLEHKNLLANLKKGDEVITSSGIFGRVAGIDEKAVQLEIANNVRIRVSKTSVAGLAVTGAEEKK